MLLKSGRSINPSDYFVEILKLTIKLHQLSGLVDSFDFEIQTMPGLVDEHSCFGEEPTALSKEKDPLTLENKVVLALETETFELKTTTGFLVGSHQQVKARMVETERDLKRKVVLALETENFELKTTTGFLVGSH